MNKTDNTNLVNRIREIQKSDKANRKCANCFESGPIYVCIDYHTFVCTECSGIHRELEHKVKSISMSNWSQDDIDALEFSGGNVRDREVFLATFDDGQFVHPSSSDRESLREFIRLKYIVKKWSITGPQRSSPPKSESKSSKKKKHDSLSVSNDWAEGGFPISPTKPPTLAQSVVVHDLEISDLDKIFENGISHLQKLLLTNSAAAKAIAERVISTLEKSIIKTSLADPSFPSRNPFDHVIPQSVVGLPILLVPTSATKSDPEKPPSFYGRIEATKPCISSNPFDSFP
jgi:hypothetical protein